MKVFACKRQQYYSGGLIIVAANTVEEAFATFVNDDRYDWMIDSRNAEGMWADKRDKNAIIWSDFYPKEMWFEIRTLTANVETPQVIEENGYTE